MNNTMVLIKKNMFKCYVILRSFGYQLFLFFRCNTADSNVLFTINSRSVRWRTGITIDPSMATQNGGEVLASTLGSQFDQLGLMILVISMMGTIQTDKANGMLAFILTRPVTITSYVGGKIVSNYVMVACSVTIGYVTSYLYVNFLLALFHLHT